MSSSLITSLSNPWVKYARSLHQRRARYRERAFLVEGPRIIADALDAGATPRAMFIAPTRARDQFDDVIETARSRSARVLLVAEHVFDQLTDTITPQGIAAVFPFPDLPVVVPDGEPPLLLLVDRLQDPGNLGTLLRSALGAGAHAVYLSPGTTDPFAPKVVRAAAGSHFKLPIKWVRWDAPEELLMRCSQRLAATPRARRQYDEVDWTSSATVLIGSEAHGLSDAAMAIATDQIAIPLRGGLESLNAAVAGSIILFEAARQRRAAGRI